MLHTSGVDGLKINAERSSWYRRPLLPLDTRIIIGKISSNEVGMVLNPVEDSSDGPANEVHEEFHSGVLVEGLVSEHGASRSIRSARFLTHSSLRMTFCGDRPCGGCVRQDRCDHQLLQRDFTDKIQSSSTVGRCKNDRKHTVGTVKYGLCVVPR